MQVDEDLEIEAGVLLQLCEGRVVESTELLVGLVASARRRADCSTIHKVQHFEEHLHQVDFPLDELKIGGLRLNNRVLLCTQGS